MSDRSLSLRVSLEEQRTLNKIIEFIDLTSDEDEVEGGAIASEFRNILDMLTVRHQ